MKKILLLLVAAIMFCACATQTKIEYVDREVVKYQTQIVHDTLTTNTRDSVFYSIYEKGDTVFSIKYVEKTKYRDRIVISTDTLTRDSIQTKVITETSTITKYRIPWWAWVCLTFTLLALLLIAYNIYKWLKH